MSSLEGLAAGDPIVVKVAHSATVMHRTVAKMARVWMTDNRQHRYRISDGRTGDEPYAEEAMTPAQWEQRQEEKLLNTRLRSWGWTPRHDLTLPQLRRAAALVAEFEAERSGGLL